ncbi:hypothetical protein CHLRE_02g092284v5 [Chlamydomonas reinhardtii]|uniref:cysteine dioxygenase n=1 Tax=Chlamydomonas reinhardtii TaxID=3055 RepID=A0A2K3E1C4_CHLRE|nr:uncharacterized protein CHLRE_02g092284v5 [Chlamydomonas reinhardtii]PNW86576.1 hypothetical protein CHLRE_02g092284v5 [Chlamydomonas reinhardtii]
MQQNGTFASYNQTSSSGGSSGSSSTLQAFFSSAKAAVLRGGLNETNTETVNSLLRLMSHISLEELGLDPDMVQDPFLGALKLHLRDRPHTPPSSSSLVLPPSESPAAERSLSSPLPLLLLDAALRGTGAALPLSSASRCSFHTAVQADCMAFTNEAFWSRSLPALRTGDSLALLAVLRSTPYSSITVSSRLSKSFVSKADAKYSLYTMPVAAACALASRPWLACPLCRRIKYMRIYEDHTLTFGLFCFPAGATIPLHNHPGMTVFSRLLFGRLRVSAFDWVVQPPEPITEGSGHRAQLVYDATVEASSPPLVLFPASGGNLHEFTAETPCAVLDLLTPPYEPPTRNCTYYRLQRPPMVWPVARSAGGRAPVGPPLPALGEVVELEVFEPPDSFEVVSGLYPGDPVS